MYIHNNVSTMANVLLFCFLHSAYSLEDKPKPAEPSQNAQLPAIPSPTPQAMKKLNSDPPQNPSQSSVDFLPDRPIQLLRPDPVRHLKLEIVERNVQHLHHIKTAVAVVAVVGKFHSGKSFLLNQLMGKQEGFGVGPYVRPQTMGIWMWGKVFK